MHAISALVDKDRERYIRGSIGNYLCHFLHDEWISNDKAEHLRPVAGCLFPQDIAGVESNKFHQVRGSESPSHHGYELDQRRGRGTPS